MNKCDPKTLLKEHGLKTTKQRILLLEKILKKKSVFSINDLEKELLSDMDQATIYRIMAQLREKGIVREILSDSDNRLFEKSCIHNPVHPHFHCTKCKKIICLDQLDEKIHRAIEKAYSDVTIDEISINISGTCLKCK